MSEQTVPTPEAPKKVIPLSEFSKHNTPDDCWMAINGKVYNVTNFIEQHPGGEEVILEHGGTDATVPFDEIGHSDQAVEMLDDLYVGEGNPEELKASTSVSNASGATSGDGSASKLPLVVCILVAAAAFFYFKANAE